VGKYTPRNALTPELQGAEIRRLMRAGFKRSSPRELARFGWQDAPRRPCYRARRLR
jgi:hypothetical protein